MEKKLNIAEALRKGIIFSLRNKVVFALAGISAFLTLITNPNSLTFNPLILVLGVITGLFTTLVITRFIYERVTGDFSWKRIIQVSIYKFIPVSAATLVVTLITVAGFILLFIPGIYLLFRLFFYFYAILIDNESIIGSLKKSWAITKGNWWRIFLFSVIVSLPFFLGSNLFMLGGIFIAVYFFVLLFSISWYAAAMVFAYLKLKDMQSSPAISDESAAGPNEENSIKPWRKTLVTLTIIFIAAGALTLGGLYLYNKVKAVFDPAVQQKIARSIVSYELPEGYELQMAMEIAGIKTASFARSNSKQGIALVAFPRQKGLSDNDFKTYMPALKDLKPSDPDYKAANLMLKGSGYSDIKVLDVKEFDFADKKFKIPFAICKFTKGGETQEGFWGVLNFSGSKKSIFIFDLAEPGKYDFELTKEFVQALDAPEK